MSKAKNNDKGSAAAPRVRRALDTVRNRSAQDQVEALITGVHRWRDLNTGQEIRTIRRFV